MSRVMVVVLSVLLVGCANHDSGTAEASLDASGDSLIVPGVRVGKYVIGQDTMASILGSDTSDARNKFAEKGLYFEFEQGKQLTGITVTSPKYATQRGFRIGTSAGDIESALGASDSHVMKEVHGKFEWPSLSYPGILFLLREGIVYAIRVGNP